MTATTRLVTLSLLTRRPMNGYELIQTMTLAGLDRWAGGVLPGSIYHALGKMESEDLVYSTAECAGNRWRKVYAITAGGRSELRDLVGNALQRPPHDLRSDLALAANSIDLINAAEAAELLAKARAIIESGLSKRVNARAAWRRPTKVEEALLDNADNIALADLELVDRLRALVASGESASRGSVRSRRPVMDARLKDEYGRGHHAG